LNTTFKACSCSHSNNSGELKQNKKLAEVGSLLAHVTESQIVAMVSGMAGSRDLDDVIET